MLLRKCRLYVMLVENVRDALVFTNLTKNYLQQQNAFFTIIGMSSFKFDQGDMSLDISAFKNHGYFGKVINTIVMTRSETQGEFIVFRPSLLKTSSHLWKVNFWDGKRFVLNEKNLFPVRLMNLRGSVLNARTFNHEPFTIMKGNQVIGGIEVSLSLL